LTPINNSRTRICVPVCVRRASELAAAIERAAEYADVIELRFDCFEDDTQLDAALLQVPALTNGHTRSFIYTFRPQEQGGQRTLDPAARTDFWTRRLLPILEESTRRIDDGQSATRHFIDLELDLFDDLQRRDALSPLSHLATLIVSHHDFVGVPADLEAIYERMTQMRARVLKIAVQADEITDCLPVIRLLERARREGRALVAIAMGEAGLLTRVLAPALGSFLTYGSLDAEHATAPGQVTARELRELYRVDSISEDTQVMGLIGSPVAHSLSPHIHNAAFAARSLDAVFIPFETRDARAFVRRMAHPRTRELAWNLRGLSVTAPHKSVVIDELDFVEPSAREIGAVNTVLVADGELHGYNTDAAAALAPLDGLIDLKGARVALVGAGGAARAALWSLREAGASTTVFARNAEGARVVAEKFSASSQSLEGARFRDFDLVINATPLGTRGAREHETVATVEQLRGARVAYDLVYNPAETLFLREARAAGCESVFGGLAMLVAQAVAQFELWTGVRAPVEVMRAAAELKLFGE
jgi:3-dehydroquinate dehydratase/shikimate dehydrogenase